MNLTVTLPPTAGPPLTRPQLQTLSAAQELFFRRGLRAVGPDELAACLGQPALAPTVAAKAALVHAVFGAYIRQMREVFTRQQARSTTAVAEMLALREWVWQEAQQIRAPVFWELAQEYPATWQLWQEHCTGFVVEYLRDNLRWGMRQELYHPYLDIDFLPRFWVQQISASPTTGMSDSPGLNPVEVRQTIAAHFMAGIITPAGAAVARRLQESPPDY